jgi:hypothetical protein
VRASDQSYNQESRTGEIKKKNKGIQGTRNSLDTFGGSKLLQKGTKFKEHILQIAVIMHKISIECSYKHA